MTDNCTKEESGWNVESVKSQYVNISTYRPLSGKFYMDLPVELKSPRKGLINIKNKDQKNFLWCHFGHINPSKEHPERIEKTLLKNLIIMKLSFPYKKKILAKL